jgi:hypothetical protein
VPLHGGSDMNLAYLDAGSGSLIVQALLAGFAGTVVAVKLGWRRIAGWLRRRPAEEVTDKPS